MSKSSPSRQHVIHVVSPGFNKVGVSDPIQALTAPADMSLFDEETQNVLNSGNTFTLVLGQGFEGVIARDGLGNAPCGGLASLEQLRFLQDHGMTQILMASRHGTLVQNARSIGIDVIVGGGT